MSRLLAALGFGAALLLAAPAQAVWLQTGDVIASRWGSADNGSVQLLHVDGRTGATQIIASGGLLQRGYGSVAIDGSRNILVGTWGGIVRVNPVTGQVSTLVSGGYFGVYSDYAAPSFTFDAAGQLVVATRQTYSGGMGRLFRVNPATGAQTLISQGGMFGDLRDVAVQADGQILVTTDFGAQEPVHALLRVNPATGAQSVVNLGQFRPVTVDRTGQVYVGTWLTHGGQVARVDPDTGDLQLVATLDSFLIPPDMTWFGDDLLLTVLDNGGPNVINSIVALDPDDGSMRVLSSGGLLGQPSDRVILQSLDVVRGASPEPGALTLVGAALAALGLVPRRRAG